MPPPHMQAFLSREMTAPPIMFAVQCCDPGAEPLGRASQGLGADAAFLKRSGRASPVARMPGIARNTSSMNF